MSINFYSAVFVSLTLLLAYGASAEPEYAGNPDEAPVQAVWIGPSVLPRTGPEPVNRVALSPDGTYFAVTITDGDDFFVVTSDNKGQNVRPLPLLKDSLPVYIDWPSQNFLLVAYRRTKLSNRDRGTFDGISEKEFKKITHLISYRLDTGDSWYLNQKEKMFPGLQGYWDQLQSLDRVTNIDSASNRIIIDHGTNYSVYDIDAESIDMISVDARLAEIENLITQDANVVLSIRDQNNLRVRCVEVNGEFRNLLQLKSPDNHWAIQPVAVDETGGFFLKRNENGDYTKLVRYSCAEPELETVVHEVEKGNIEGVFFDYHRQELLGLWSNTGASEIILFDEENQKKIDSLREALGGSQVWPVIRSLDGKSWLVYAETMTSGGEYYRIDESSDQFEAVKLITFNELMR